MASEEAQFAARADRLAGPRGVVGFMPAAARESALRGGAAVSPQNRYVLPQFSEKTPYGMKTQDPYTKLFEDRIIFMGCRSTTRPPTTSWPSCLCSNRRIRAVT